MIPATNSLRTGLKLSAAFALLPMPMVMGTGFFAVNAQAQLPPPAAKLAVGARMPALSPDGSRLAFVYRGDVWIVDSHGGHATPLTRNVEMDAYPQFSPDGNWISFSSTRTGNWDVFVVPAAGGEPKRITWHDGLDVSYGWSPDGKSLILTSRRESGDPEMLTVDVATLKLKHLAQDYVGMAMPNYSPDGRSVVYGHFDSFPWTRPRYHGSAATQIALLDTATGNSRYLTSDSHQHLFSRFLPDGKHIACVTYSDETPSSHKVGENPGKYTDTDRRTPNLWEFDLNGKGKQVTHFVGGAVRFPAVASKSGDIAFEYGSDLWILKAGGNAPTRVAITATEDDAQNTFRHETLTTGVTEAEPSPDGTQFAFGLKGDVWTIAIDKPKGAAGKTAEFARRLTDWPGDDSDFLWSQDGKKLYYRSDRDYVTGIYEMDVATRENRSLWSRKENVDELYLSPDGKELAFWAHGTEGGLYRLTIQSGVATRILKTPDAVREWQSGDDIKWSPDQKWIAVSLREVDGPQNIWIAAADGSGPVNVTRLNSGHSLPAWTPDGKYLLFSSDRDGAGLYMLSLTQDTARAVDADIKFEKPKGAVKTAIEFDQISRRIRKVTGQNPEADLQVNPDGLILYISGGDSWSVSYDGSDLKRLTAGGGCTHLRQSKDGHKLYFARNGELWFMNVDGGGQTKVNFSADYDHDIRAERVAAFAQFWNGFSRRFYDANMHGRDWAEVRKRYEPMLDAVETRQEFATLLGMMVGELESSHSEVGAGQGTIATAVTPNLGFSFDLTYAGPGLKIATVPPGAPGSYTQTKVTAGEYLLAVDGVDVTGDENYYKTVNNKQGRMVTLLVNSRPGKDGARTVKYVALTQAEYGKLLYASRVERARKQVEEKSGGKLTYLHIAGMGGDNQVTFERELYEYSIGKQGVIIDVRRNGGGNIADTLVNWLSAKPHGSRVPRDGLPESSPGRVWNKPVIVLMNETSFSNAEMFPNFMRTYGLAKLVGQPTPGYVIWTWGFPLIDGTSARMPGSGVYRSDGTSMENRGEQPDYRVALTAEDWLNERDPQLEKAIELLLKH